MHVLENKSATNRNVPLYPSSQEALDGQGVLCDPVITENSAQDIIMCLILENILIKMFLNRES